MNYGAFEEGHVEDAFLDAAFDIVRNNVGAIDQLRELKLRDLNGNEADRRRSGWNVDIGAWASVCVVLAAVVTFLVMALKQGQIAWAVLGMLIFPIGLIVGGSWWWHWFWQYVIALTH